MATKMTRDEVTEALNLIEKAGDQIDQTAGKWRTIATNEKLRMDHMASIRRKGQVIRDTAKRLKENRAAHDQPTTAPDTGTGVVGPEQVADAVKSVAEMTSKTAG